MKKFLGSMLFVTICGILFAPAAQAAVMSASTYKIEIDSINMGGLRGTSSSYALEQTGGEIATGTLTGTSNTLYGGFQLPVFADASSTSTASAGGGGPAFIPFEILDIVVQSVTQDAATITFRTNKNAKTQTDFGTSVDPEGSVAGDGLRSGHTVTLENLQPGTDYYFRIAAESDRQERVKSGNRKFKTLPPPPAKVDEPPANVARFTARGEDGRVLLSWGNPRAGDFAGTRIMRSAAFYPANPFDGVMAYEGAADSFVDGGLQNGISYYYSAFSFDEDGNFSSGAIASATPFVFIRGEAPPPLPPPEPPVVPPSSIAPELKNLSFADFDFVQENAKAPVVAGRVQVRADEPVIIAIDYEKLPEVLKTIVATMKNDEGRSFSFLLRVDKEKLRYTATVEPPAGGLYAMTFTVVDYKNQGLQQVAGELAVQEFSAGAVSPADAGDTGLGRFFPEMIAFLVIALLLGAIWIFASGNVRRRAARASACLVLALLFSGMWFAEPAAAAFNTQMNYQGKLTDTSNNAVDDGDYNFKFQLCTDSACAASVWSETRETTNKVTVTNGIFSVLLGEVTSIASVDFNQTLWLEVQVGGTGSSPSYETLTPRKKLGAVAAAFEADKLDGIGSASFVRSDAADTISELLTITADPTGSGVGDGSFYVNPASADANETLLGVAVGGTSKFRVDEDGDVVLAGDVTVAGGDITLGATSIFSGGDVASLNNVDAIDATTEDTIETALDTLSNVTTVGALDSGSITSGFGAIDNGTSNITTGGVLKIDVDGTAENAAGSLTLGAGNDAGIFFDGTDLQILTNGAGASGIILDSEDDTVEVKGSGVLQATFDTGGLNLASGDAYEINGTSVLSATTLGSGVVSSSLTSVGTISSGTWQGTTIAVDRGGTGQTSYTDGQLLIGNSTGNTLAKATLTEGNYIDVTNGSGTITLAFDSTELGTVTWFDGTAATDIVWTFDGETNDGTFGFYEDEDAFAFTNSSVGIGSSSPTDLLTLRSDSGGATVDVLRLENLGTAAADSALGVNFYANRTTGGSTNFAGIDATITSIDNTNFAGKLDLNTAIDGTLTTQITIGNPNITMNAPLNVDVGGDVGFDYDIQFLNTGTSYITSEGPLRIDAGDANHAENLTLGTQGTGDVVVDVNDAANATGGFKVLGSTGNVFRINSGGAIIMGGDQQTLAVNDTTPDVSGGTHFITANTTNPTLISDFDAGANTLEPGHLLFIELGDAVTDFDCTSSGITCGGADVTEGAAGDFYTFLYDGTDWKLVSYVDISDTQGGADIAELFPSRQDLEPGDLVAIDTGFPVSVKKTTDAYETRMIGIVSTEPGIILGNPNDKGVHPIGLVGRVPTKVSLEGGEIKIGDLITSSSVEGVGMRATGMGRTIGYALEEFDGTIQQCTITEKSQETNSNTQNAKEPICETKEVEETQILVFIDPAWSFGSFEEDGLLAGEEEDARDESAANRGGLIGAIKSALGAFTGTVKTAGNWVFEHITAKTARLDKIELVDQRTGDVYCTWISSGDWEKVQAKCEQVQYINGEVVVEGAPPDYEKIAEANGLKESDNSEKESDNSEWETESNKEEDVEEGEEAASVRQPEDSGEPREDQSLEEPVPDPEPAPASKPEPEPEPELEPEESKPEEPEPEEQPAEKEPAGETALAENSDEPKKEEAPEEIREEIPEESIEEPAAEELPPEEDPLAGGEEPPIEEALVEEPPVEEPVVEQEPEPEESPAEEDAEDQPNNI